MDKKTQKLIREAIYTSNLLTDALAMVRHYEEEVKKQSDRIHEITGLDLWTYSANDDKRFFWRGYGGQGKSVEYKTRAEAIKALLEDKIEWL